MHFQIDKIYGTSQTNVNLVSSPGNNVRFWVVEDLLELCRAKCQNNISSGHIGYDMSTIISRWVHDRKKNIIVLSLVVRQSYDHRALYMAFVRFSFHGMHVKLSYHCRAIFHAVELHRCVVDSLWQGFRKVCRFF